MNIQQRLERLAQRRTDPSLFEAQAKSYESYRDLAVPEAIKYIIGAMQPIDIRYTERTIEQGNRVRDQLTKRLASGVEYRFQGSVLNDTHIRQHSDIDLLVFVEKFTFVKAPLAAKNPYQGDSTQDLRDLRSETRTALESAFPAVTVDDAGSRSIELSGGSLARIVDVVPAAWLDTIEYDRTGDEVHRGVKVFNKLDGSFAANYPFKNAAEIDAKDRRCGGGMRKAARFMKTLKADSDVIKLSSYDIAAIAWNMSDSSLNYGMPWDMKVFYGCRDYVRRLVDDADLRGSLCVPDGTRRVFTSGHATVDGATALLAEIDELANQVAPTVEAHVTKELKLSERNMPIYYPELLGHRPAKL
jgi:nucleotidyltransferase-like protein